MFPSIFLCLGVLLLATRDSFAARLDAAASAAGFGPSARTVVAVLSALFPLGLIVSGVYGYAMAL